jgi:glycosyltransferase involved in cell wall biosynthesis
MTTERRAVIAEPLVSIILPVYNGEAHLDAALDAALGQTYRSLELIVVDDGSRDRTRAIVEARAARDSRVRLIGQANRGVAAARNRAIEAARGEFIAPLDADDIWSPSKVERQVGRMLEVGDETALVYGWWVWIDSEGAVLGYSPQWRLEGQAADALLQVNFVGCGSMPLFRRRDLEQLGGYDEALSEGCEDWDLSLRIAERARVAVVPSVLVGYRIRRDSRSTGTSAMWRSHGIVIDRVRQRRPDLDPSLIRRSQDQFTLHLAGVCFWARQYGQAVGWGVRALRSTLGFKVLPYVFRLFAETLGRRARSARGTVRRDVRFGDSDTPQSLIPYDRIYRRRFERLQRMP